MATFIINLNLRFMMEVIYIDCLVGFVYFMMDYCRRLILSFIQAVKNMTKG